MEEYQSSYISENNKGLTMIEALMAMAIFAIGFLAVGTMVFSTMRNNSAGDILTQATMLARSRIESLKTLTIAQLDKQCLENDEPERLGEIFDRSCSVDTSFSNSAYIIEVRVSWRKWGKNREVILRTLTRGNGT
jgi:prepilin-type N-terminal cleavage/methylation domain-containing protein